MSPEFELEIKRKIANMKIGEWKRIYGAGAMAMYVTPCAGGCGEPILNWTKRPLTVFKCAKCREIENSARTELKENIASLTKKKRITDAKENLAKQFGETNEYDAAFKAIERTINKVGWFQSCAEVLAAAELIRTKTKAQPQVSIGKWRVDYVLPDLKVLLEIDGGFHDDPRKIDKEKRRDAAILKIMGNEWVMVRIPEMIVKTEIKSLMVKIRKKIAKRKQFN